MCKIILPFALLLTIVAFSFGQGQIQIRSLGFRAVPWSNTTYIPGSTNSQCFGTGTQWTSNLDIYINCNTVVSSDIPVTISKLFVYNLVESSSYRYLIGCTRNWIGSKCSTMNVGESYNAEEEGSTMDVYAYTSYNDQQKGKMSRVKFQVLNKWPIPSNQVLPPDTSHAQQSAGQAVSRTWNQEPTGFRGLDFGTNYSDAMTKQEWFKNACAGFVNPNKFTCSFDHLIGSIKVKSIVGFDPNFESVLMQFSPADFEAMKAVFVEKYGEPHAAQQESKRDESNKELLDDVLLWQGKSVRVMLEKYPGKESQSLALISTLEAIERTLKEVGKDF